MSVIEAIILGLIQGLTEFLPVSSSGHIELGKVLLNVQVNDPLLFSIVVHGATALSTIVVFHKVIIWLFKDLLKFKWNDGTKYAFIIAISMVPVAIAGVLFEEGIEKLFDGQVVLVGIMLLLTSGLLFLTTTAKEKTGEVSPFKAGIVGIAQAIAILPGISRSGATIGTSLLLGIKKEEAARFSFLMVLPPILGATLLKGKKFMEQGGEGDLSTMVLIVGFIAAFVSGLFACKWMIQIVKRSKLQYFAIYCAIVGIIAIIGGLLL